jgi:hypothetical protein
MSEAKEQLRADLYHELRKLQIEYHKRAEPIIKALVDLTATDPPAPIILPDGSVINYIGPGHDK